MMRSVRHSAVAAERDVERSNDQPVMTEAPSVARVVTEGTRVCFAPPEKTYNLGSGISRIPLQNLNLPVLVDRVAVPAHSSGVYLVATIQNRPTAPTSGGGRQSGDSGDNAPPIHSSSSSPPPPLLAGPAMIFLDGAFRMERSIPYTAGGGNVSFVVGIDESLTVSRLRHQAPTKVEGFKLLGTKRDIAQYDFDLSIHNAAAVDRVVDVSEAVPLPPKEEGSAGREKGGGSDITVRVHRLSCDAEGVLRCDRDEATGIVKWRVAVPAFQERTVSVTYDVAWPSGETIHGLP